jgi:protein phosphatase 1G
MGSYLSEPVTDKQSTDESNDELICGASAMQGWRLSQEDAHNCILDYDTNTSFFAVYDGHGGHEVARYCSQELPNFLKKTSEYQEDKIEEALVSGFLRFDATITEPDVVTVLKELAGIPDDLFESEDEENVDNLYEEATMPIEQVMEKYTCSKKDPLLRSRRKKEKLAAVANENTKTDSDPTIGTSSSAGCSSSSTASLPDKSEDGVSSSSEAQVNAKNGDENKVETNGPQESSEVESSVQNSSEVKEAASSLSENKDESSIQNGEVSTPDSKTPTKVDVSSSSTPVENGTVSKKGKGKAVIKPEPVTSQINTRPKRTPQQLYTNWLNCGEESEDSEEEDQTFVASNGEESSDNDEDDGVNIAICTSESDSSAEEVDEEGGEEGEEEEEEDDDDDDEDMNYARNIKEIPGSDSGCTAVVALLRNNKLYVANAGDSRCIVCRNGKAIEMSIDHKPEDEPETERVLKAGGKVTGDGRINGGLNLSRAIGDHAYKQNKELSDREQMITALPDVKTLTINPGEDEFMVLACDGIWNSMSSQEVVDFIKPRMTQGVEKLSKICEQIFDHCLSPESWFDGIGCDNMTAIIVKFKSSVSKRAASPQPEENEPKRAKTEVNSEVQVDTTV